jgi:hypothetical protein
MIVEISPGAKVMGSIWRLLALRWHGTLGNRHFLVLGAALHLVWMIFFLHRL